MGLALWANGKEVGEAWVSPVEESKRSSERSLVAPLCSPRLFLIYFPAKIRFCHPGTTNIGVRSWDVCSCG